ncbi:alpha/beta fold hydrolase [Neobacillus sp. PS3-40]|uniref:alpha/beta fold hydrolase n=1 Tax=Neobacillus sp. PS3-40 TaxID=3070679 RepID=UPI0027DF84DA|nr:alpha/beta fold hydrolase [Neobacillus sp. PS3-40]WML44554.1 alpha/beta fold hydrolase [Neobacillus sp. PS3-40]
MKNGEYRLMINGIYHWIKVEGQENNTIPLFIIHGGPGGNLYFFERTIGPLLSKERTIIYYEQRGCGRSGSPGTDNAYTFKELIGDFKELQERTGFDKVDLLGYSFGGELALEIAHALPNKINKIILSSPSLIGLKIQYLIQLVGFMSIGDTTLVHKVEQILSQQNSIEEKYLEIWKSVDSESVDRLFFENQNIAKEYRRLTEESGLVNTGLMLKALQNNPPKIPLFERLKDIHQSILIITGAQDRNSGLAISNLIHRNLINSKLILFNKSAHFPYLEETDNFIEKLSAFLE